MANIQTTNLYCDNIEDCFYCKHICIEFVKVDLLGSL